MLHLTREIDELPLIPAYTPGELTQSHLQRIADANVIGMSRLRDILLKFLKCEGMDCAKNEAALSVANLLGHPPELVERMSLSSYFAESLQGTSTKQVCPACLAEGRPAHLLIGEQAYSICPFHAIAHLSRCPSCNRYLAWGIGDFSHCCCGFDLSNAPMVEVGSETLSFYLSCLSDQNLKPMSVLSELNVPLSTKDHLRTTASYLMLDADIQVSANTFNDGLPAWASRGVSRWLAIGEHIGDSGLKLRDRVMGIEARHIFTKARLPHLISEAEEHREAITWWCLQSNVHGARRRVMQYARNGNANLLDRENDYNLRMICVKPLESPNGLSPLLKDELQIARRQIGLEIEKAPSASLATVLALDEMGCNLSWIGPFVPRQKQILSASTTVMSLIAAGVVTPWTPAPIEQWHIDFRCIAGVFQKLNIRPLESMDELSEDAYVGSFSCIFSPTSRLLDWLKCSSNHLSSRIHALLQRTSLVEDGRRLSVNDLLLPEAMWAFLSLYDCDIYSVSNPRDWRGFRMVCRSEEHACKALMRAWIRAKRHYRSLAHWPRVAANVADRYLHTDYGNLPCAQQMADADRPISYFCLYPYAAMQAAIRELSDYEKRGIATKWNCIGEDSEYPPATIFERTVMMNDSDVRPSVGSASKANA